MTKAEYQRRYKKKYPEKIKQMSKRGRVLGIERFGGNRMEVLRRDDFRCVKCDMTDAQHVDIAEKYKVGESVVSWIGTRDTWKDI